MIEGNNIIDFTIGPKLDDLRAPASGINPAGQLSPPTIDSTDGSLIFSKSNIISIWVQMPHAWKEGTPIHPHLHWMKTSTAPGIPHWQYKYKIANVGDVFTAYTALTDGIDEVPHSNTINKHSIFAFPWLDMTGYRISCMLNIILQRTNDGSDTYADAAKLLEFDIHYQLDSNGSSQEFIK